MSDPNAIQDRVFALVAEQTGEKQGKLSLATTLGHDLGMDGDDAVEFFERFRSEFALDLQNLYRDWKFYFGPEGTPITSLLCLILPGLAFGIGLTTVFPALPAWLMFLIAYGMWFGLFFSWVRKQQKSMPQISIADLIQIANSGRWTKQVSEEARRKLPFRFVVYGIRGWLRR